MRGIVLAGGTGSRLGTLTRVVNKHLLPIGAYPMIYWPINTLRQNNITDITIVSTPRGIGQLAELLGGSFTYRVQDQAGGIAEAIRVGIGVPQWNTESIAIILGDNIFGDIPILTNVSSDTAHVFLKEVPAARAPEFGIPTIEKGRIVRLDEKPSTPACNLAVTGLYVFRLDVLSKIGVLKHSKRGELEVTDLLNFYAERELLNHTIVGGFWGDAGTVDGLEECSRAMRGIT